MCILTYIVTLLLFIMPSPPWGGIKRRWPSSLCLSVCRAGSGVVRIDPLRFPGGWCTRRLNEASSVLYLSMFYCVVVYYLVFIYLSRSCTTSFGPRSFGSSGPTAWNDMPAHLRNLDLTLNDFRQLLKTALFQTVSVYLPRAPLWQS